MNRKLLNVKSTVADLANVKHKDARFKLNKNKSDVRSFEAHPRWVRSCRLRLRLRLRLSCTSGKAQSAGRERNGAGAVLVQKPSRKSSERQNIKVKAHPQTRAQEQKRISSSFFLVQQFVTCIVELNISWPKTHQLMFFGFNLNIC